jgi:hypothetical protein
LAKVEGLIVEQEIVAQEFDLEKILGVDLSADPGLANDIGGAIVDYIVKRAGDNKGIGGKALPAPYSEEYASSPEFKQFGKSKNKVNMRLTGDMLNAVDVLGFDGSVLTVGIENDQAPKAHGHMTGKDGQVPAMKREWFGLTKPELKEITSKYNDRINALPDRSKTAADFLTKGENQAIDSIFKRFTLGDLFALTRGKDAK